MSLSIIIHCEENQSPSEAPLELQNCGVRRVRVLLCICWGELMAKSCCPFIVCTYCNSSIDLYIQLQVITHFMMIIACDPVPDAIHSRLNSDVPRGPAVARAFQPQRGVTLKTAGRMN